MQRPESFEKKIQFSFLIGKKNKSRSLIGYLVVFSYPLDGNPELLGGEPTVYTPEFGKEDPILVSDW